jgi:O-antigen/teichoic acid export membrane protein
VRTEAAVVARNVAWLAGGEAALKGALFVAGVLVARGMGPAAMGVFTVAYGAALVGVQVLAAGQPEVIIRETARERIAARGFVASARVPQRRVALGLLPLAAGAVLLVPEASLRWALLAFLPYAWLRSWMVTAAAAFKGLDRMEVEVLARGAEALFALAATAWLAWRGGPVWAVGLAFTAGAVAALAWVHARLRRVGEGGGAPPWEAMWRQGLPFLGLALATQLLVRADSFVQAALGLPTSEIGLYGVAHAATWGLLGLAQLLAVAVYPTVSRRVGEGRLGPTTVLWLWLVGSGLGLVLSALVWLLRAPVVHLVFGGGYDASVPLLGTLGWALPGACGAMIMGVVIAGTRRQAWGLAMQSGLVTLAVAANVVAVPRWGVAGSAAVAVGVQVLAGVSALAVAGAASRAPAGTGAV